MSFVSWLRLPGQYGSDSDHHVFCSGISCGVVSLCNCVIYAVLSLFQYCCMGLYLCSSLCLIPLYICATVCFRLLYACFCCCILCHYVSYAVILLCCRLICSSVQWQYVIAALITPMHDAMFPLKLYKIVKSTLETSTYDTKIKIADQVQGGEGDL